MQSRLLAQLDILVACDFLAEFCISLYCLGLSLRVNCSGHFSY